MLLNDLLHSPMESSLTCFDFNFAPVVDGLNGHQDVVVDVSLATPVDSSTPVKNVQASKKKGPNSDRSTNSRLQTYLPEENLLLEEVLVLQVGAGVLENAVVLYVVDPVDVADPHRNHHHVIGPLCQDHVDL